MTITPVEIRTSNGEVFYDAVDSAKGEAIEKFVNAFNDDVTFIAFTGGIYRVSGVAAITFGKELEE